MENDVKPTPYAAILQFIVVALVLLNTVLKQDACSSKYQQEIADLKQLNEMRADSIELLKNENLRLDSQNDHLEQVNANLERKLQEKNDTILKIRRILGVPGP